MPNVPLQTRRPLLLRVRHPERSSLRTLQAAQSKDPDTICTTQTPRTFQPRSRVPHLRDGFIVAKVGSQDLQG
jgi:hypothetical protein